MHNGWQICNYTAAYGLKPQHFGSNAQLQGIEPCNGQQYTTRGKTQQLALSAVT
jgi:hypothetical protein